MQIDLPPELERLVEDKLRSGRYGSAIDVLSASLEALEREEQEEAEKIANLRRLLDEAIEDVERGNTIPGEEVLERALSEFRRRVGH